MVNNTAHNAQKQKSKNFLRRSTTPYPDPIPVGRGTPTIHNLSLSLLWYCNGARKYGPRALQSLHLDLFKSYCVITAVFKLPCESHSLQFLAKHYKKGQSIEFIVGTINKLSRTSSVQ